MSGPEAGPSPDDSQDEKRVLDLAALRIQIQRADDIESVRQASKRMGRLFETIPEGGIPLALDLIDEIQTHMARMRAVDTLFSRWAEIDPQSALVATGTVTGRMSRDFARQAALSVWMRTDFEDAFEYINKLDDRRLQERLRRSAVSQLAESAPDKAVKVLRSSEDSSRQERRLLQLGNFWGRVDPKSGLKWAEENLHQEFARNVFANNVINGWALERPAEALEFVRLLPEDSPNREQLTEVLRGWASEDPSALATARPSVSPKKPMPWWSWCRRKRPRSRW